MIHSSVEGAKLVKKWSPSLVEQLRIATFATTLTPLADNLPQMNILLVCDCKLPVSAYDDKARLTWWLGKELARLGHQVSFLLRESLECDFAQVLVSNDKKNINEQIPESVELVHFQCDPKQTPDRPYLITCHENSSVARSFDPNTVFLSHSHAQQHGGSVYVYPGADFAEYSTPDFSTKRIWFHFLGSALRKGRNIRGAIDLADRAGARLHVVGGSRVNFRQGFRIPLSTTARFHGALSPDGRDAILNASKGLILPVLWQEPFSLSVVDSLYFGCPVFGTPFGALPEQLGKKVNHKNKTIPTSGTVDAFYADYGCLTVKKAELVEALKNAADFEREKCHEFAMSHFSVQRMAADYLQLYEQVMKGLPLHAVPPAIDVAVGEKLLAMQ